MGSFRRDAAPAPCLMVVLGTRPEAIKLFPIIRELQKSRVRPFVVNTGQHSDMVTPVLEFAGTPADASLDLPLQGRTLNTMVRDIVGGLDALLERLRGGPERRATPRIFGAAGTPSPYPAAVLVHGDTASALAGALAADGAGLPLIHVEAGLRTGNRHSPFPEEINRQLIARIAALHLAPIAANKANLMREGIDGRLVCVTGNSGIDAIQSVAGLSWPWPDPRVARVDTHPGPIIVATAHRRESWGRGIDGVAQGLASVAKARSDVLLVVPMHPNPAIRAQFLPPLGNLDNVILTEAFRYPEFARLLGRATLAVSDSAGIQEEAPTLRTPVLVTRDTTERMEGIRAGGSTLVGTDPEVIARTALDLLDDPAAYRAMVDAPQPFGDGHASARITAALEHVLFDTPAPQPYISPRPTAEHAADEVPDGPDFDRLEVLEAAGYGEDETRYALAWARGQPDRDGTAEPSHAPG